MNFLHLPIPLFVILQLFTSIVWSSDSSSISTSVASGSGSIPTTATSTGTTNSTGSASPTSSAHYPSLSGDSNCGEPLFCPFFFFKKKAWLTQFSLFFQWTLALQVQSLIRIARV